MYNFRVIQINGRWNYVTPEGEKFNGITYDSVIEQLKAKLIK